MSIVEFYFDNYQEVLPEVDKPNKRKLRDGRRTIKIGIEYPYISGKI